MPATSGTTTTTVTTTVATPSAPSSGRYRPSSVRATASASNPYLLAVIWQEAFRFVFNAQFLGADVASLLPRELSYVGFIGTFVTLTIGTWVFGFAWAWLYNRLAR